MLSRALGATAVLLATGSAYASQFPRAVAGNGYVAVPVGTKDRVQGGRRIGHNRRADGSYEITLDNEDYFYAVDISIGTPPQNVTVLVDTGSSELWVNPDCESARSQQEYRQCLDFGHYDPDKSKTPPTGPFGHETINYGDVSQKSSQSSADITYYTDDIAFDSAKITNQTFGVVVDSEGQSKGIFGLAPDIRHGFDSEKPYSFVLNTMADQGVIQSRVFSLDLRHAEDETGALIYGGLDRNKYIGSLAKHPLSRGIKGEYRLGVSLESIGLTSGGVSDHYDLKGSDKNVVLDSGTAISRLRYPVAEPILEALGAQSDGEGFYYVPCDYRKAGGSIDFGFNGKTINVPFSDFIVDLGDAYICYVGVAITEDQQILGDTVLRAGYFVFDWDNEEVHIAQAASCGDPDIVAVGSGSDSVPSSTGNCQSSDASFTGSGSVTQTSTGSFPTQEYTTTFTVTSCPPFEPDCSTGVVTTQTVSAASQPTGLGNGAGDSGGGNGNGDGDDGDDGDDDDAAMTNLAMTWVLVVFGTMGIVYNIL